MEIFDEEEKPARVKCHLHSQMTYRTCIECGVPVCNRCKSHRLDDKAYCHKCFQHKVERVTEDPGRCQM